MSGEQRDPFEEAANEEFRRESVAPSPDVRQPAPPEPFGRSTATRPEGPASAGDAAPIHRPHTSIAGTPPDDPMIYRDASDAHLAAARGAAGDEVRVDPTDPVVADPTGERFRDGAFSNEPGWLQPGPKNAQLCYWLNLAGFGVFVFPLVSVGIAILNRPKVGTELGTHYTYAMRTVFLAVLYGLLAYAMGRAGGIALLAVVAWFVWRNLRGLARAGSGRPMPNPNAWII